MKKLIPAVFFQKKMNGAEDSAPKKPERLELFESELQQVVGGRPILGGGDGAGGVQTFSYSAGWLDVLQADDCARA